MPRGFFGGGGWWLFSLLNTLKIIELYLLKKGGGAEIKKKAPVLACMEPPVWLWSPLHLAGSKMGMTGPQSRPIIFCLHHLTGGGQ